VQSILHPGAALSAAVLVCAVLALVLLDRGGGPMPALPAIGRLGPPLRLHAPGPPADAALAQYGPQHRVHHRRVLPAVRTP
jgi:hypothetical protein